VAVGFWSAVSGAVISPSGISPLTGLESDRVPGRIGIDNDNVATPFTIPSLIKK
jgi:hypothetical protein